MLRALQRFLGKFVYQPTIGIAPRDIEVTEDSENCGIATQSFGSGAQPERRLFFSNRDFLHNGGSDDDEDRYSIILITIAVGLANSINETL